MFFPQKIYFYYTVHTTDAEDIFLHTQFMFNFSISLSIKFAQVIKYVVANSSWIVLLFVL